MSFRQTMHKPAIKRIYYLLSAIYYLLSGVATTVAAPKAPLTYSGDHIGPYPGFSWHVSRHYAILSDMADKDVRVPGFYLYSAMMPGIWSGVRRP